MKTIDKVVCLLKKAEKVLLLLHAKPDGDTTACSCALRLALQQIGKKVAMVCPQEIPLPFHFLKGVETIQKDFLAGDFDLLIIIDCGDLRRSGFPERLIQFARLKKKLINIDHHAKNDLQKKANVNLVDFKAAATAEIIAQLIPKLSVRISREMATCLLAGLYFDTGGFQHANTTERVLKLSAELLLYGAELKKIVANVSLNKSIASLKLWGVALSRIQKTKDGLICSFLTQKDISDCGANPSDVSGIINLLNSAQEAKMAILFTETDDDYVRVSLRSSSKNIDVRRIACYFNGGGHCQAGGFMLKGKLKKTTRGWRIGRA